MDSVTISLSWGLLLKVYLAIHVLFGVITHYHSVLDVRHYNKCARTSANSNPISAAKVMALFFSRLFFGLPWFVLTRIFSPVGNRWQMTADEIDRLDNDSMGLAVIGTLCVAFVVGAFISWELSF
ncbi:MAG: hypothetical protein ACXAC5_01910 [Promethearchaeota archaeon]|jgi:hypothetical protein